ncbi:Uncharacterised protein [Pseudomonas fluorescens]|uniref:Uncharacterized protein n=1 Tax=Pseudomonas fluorescens TaxID=294 RepID=A0A3S4PHB2_PSEFL|nr:Uncharacterised protein [Pseudomonas fluorescens]
MVTAAVFAPLHFFAATTDFQRYAKASRVLVEDAQVELHDVPANDRVGIVAGEPFVEFLQNQRARVAVFEIEIDNAVVAIRCAEHVHLALAAAFKGNGIQITGFCGFDVQRDQPQFRPITGVGLELRVDQHAVGIRRSAEQHRCGDETLHQIAFRRAHVGFIDVEAGAIERGFQAHQLAVLLAIQAQNWPMRKILQGQRAELDVVFVMQQTLGGLTLDGGNECH